MNRRTLACWIVLLTIAMPPVARRAAIQHDLGRILALQAPAGTLASSDVVSEFATVLCPADTETTAKSNLESRTEVVALDIRSTALFLSLSVSRAQWIGLAARGVCCLPDGRLSSAPDRAPPLRFA